MTDLFVTGVDPADDVFTNNIGTWNSSRAQRDCAAGMHGAAALLDLPPLVEANASVETDPAKVDAFFDMGRKAFKEFVYHNPLVAVIEDGAAWLIDGHHRLAAAARFGLLYIPVYVIEAENEPDYRVLFNGQRQAPFQL